MEYAMNDDRIQNLRERISKLMHTLESNSDREPLADAESLISAIADAAERAEIRPPVMLSGRGLAQSLRMRSPFNETAEDAGFGPAWKRLLGEATFNAHALQTREKLLYYLTLWRGWLAPAQDAGNGCSSESLSKT
jgi:hypothetical protein